MTITNNIFIGIDPGANGGLAVIYQSHTEAYPLKKNSPKWIADKLESLGETPVSTAMIELVHSMRGQGVVSSFNFGYNFGMLEGFLIGSGVPYERVTPQAWQKGYGLFKQPGESHTDKKNRHKALAQELFPDLKITHATADALLIAEYARRIYER